jgi:hypothetical protein
MSYNKNSNSVGSIYINLPKKTRNPGNEKKVAQILDALESMGAYLGMTINENKLASVDANEKGYKPVLAFVSKYRNDGKGQPHLAISIPTPREDSKSSYKAKRAPTKQVAAEEDEENPFE